MARTRRTYTPEFKAEAVKLVTEQGYSVAEAARSLGLSENLIRNWKQALAGQGRTGLSRTRQALPLRGGKPPPPCREQAAPGGARHFKKSGGVLRQGGDMTFRFIEEHREQWPVRLLCETLEVSPAGYYAWRQARPPALSSNDATPSSWRSGPSTPRSRPATAAHASMPSWRPAATTAASTPSPNSCVTTASGPRRPGSSAARPRTPTTTCPWPRTFSTGSSTPRPPTSRGWRTSPTSRLVRAGCTWPPSRICTRGGSSAGRWPSTWRAVWWSMPWRWRSSDACRTRGC